MKLIGIDSKDRLPTVHADYNDAISYDYLLLVNGRYARGQYSFISKKWMIIEQFQCAVKKEPINMDELGKEMDWNVDNVIWFEEINK